MVLLQIVVAVLLDNFFQSAQRTKDEEAMRMVRVCVCVCVRLGVCVCMYVYMYACMHA